MNALERMFILREVTLKRTQNDQLRNLAGRAVTETDTLK